MKTRAMLSDDAVRLKERFYSCGTELLRPINIMIADSIPLTERESDVRKNEEYDKRKNRARALLYEQRNIVHERWLPRYDITFVGKHVDSEDWLELKQLMIDNCLDRLAERLIAMCPIMVDAKYVEQTEAAVLRVVEAQKKALEDYLKQFYVKRKPGVLSVNEEYQ